MATHSSVLAWRIPGRGSLVGHRLWGHTELDTTEATYQQQQQHGQLLKYSSIMSSNESQDCFNSHLRLKERQTNGGEDGGRWFSQNKHCPTCHGHSFIQLQSFGYADDFLSSLIYEHFILFPKGNLLVIAFVSYFGAKLHRPKIIGAGCLIMGVGTLLIAMPQFFMEQ